MTQKIKNLYELRYHRFLLKLTAVSKMRPKEHFLYRMMDGVPFKDLETAIMMTKIDFEEAVNGNNERG